MLKVLVVDDEEIMLRVVGRIFKSMDSAWEVTLVGNADDAQALIACTWFDVVLTDWRPYGRRVVEASWAANMPVVVMSGTPEDALAVVEDRAPLIAKPFSRDALEAVLLSVVAKNRQVS